MYTRYHDYYVFENFEYYKSTLIGKCNMSTRVHIQLNKSLTVEC